jgi:hypothetical protein
MRQKTFFARELTKTQRERAMIYSTISDTAPSSMNHFVTYMSASRPLSKGSYSGSNAADAALKSMMKNFDKC